MIRRSLPLLLLLACAGAGSDKADEGGLGLGEAEDKDGDGFFGDEDCNEGDPGTHSGAAELCDGVDNNCDGTVDEGVLVVWFADADEDGFGDPAHTASSCAAPEGYVTNDTDCDDSEPRAYPGAPDLCDGIDNDCDEEIDEGEATPWYADADGDGYGDPATAVSACTPPEGHVADATDCDDSHASAAPGLEEVCDELDNDCDGDVDEGVTLTWYEDRDGDSWGAIDRTVYACATPEGYAGLGGDCDDASDRYYPGAPESDCTDPNDYNCDGSVAYADDDLDGYAACAECDDRDPSRNPAAAEVCNTIDDDCDGLTDDADPSADLSTGATYYEDADSDLFGDPAAGALACAQPIGFVSDDTDCDDSDSAIRPTASEVCNSLDDDCDGDVDDADSSLDPSSGSPYYTDADGDSFGDPSTGRWSCLSPAGRVSNDSDCDDTSAAISPIDPERCNSLDDDCDGLTDDADPSLDLSTATTWYADGDADNYGLSGITARTCLQPSGYASAGGDCNDATAAANPGATEVCDLLDNDCDLSTDEGFDADGDAIVDCLEINHTVTLIVAVDDGWTGYADGSYFGAAGGWNVATTWTFSMNSGDHVLALYGADSGAAIAGFLAAVYVDGVLYSVTGDGKWKVSSSGPSGWTTASYNDSAWGTGQACTSSQVSAFWGSAPSTLRGLGASWIWHQSCTSLGSSYYRMNLTLP